MKTGQPKPPPPRIAIVCFSKAWGGLEIMVSRIANELSLRGHRTLLISPAGSPLEAEANNLAVLHYPLTPRFPHGDLMAARELSRVYRNHAIQVVLATLSRDIGTLVLAKWFHSASRLLYFQQMQFGHSKRDLLHRITYRELDRWITLTNRMKNEVRENTIVPDERITVIPFGVDVNRFDPRQYRKSRSRRMLHLPQNEHLVGLIGRIDRQKGHEDLLRAAPAILESVPKTSFVIVGEETKGEGGYGQFVKDLVQDLHLEKKVHFMPFMKDVTVLLSALDVLTVPSHSETFGYVAIEAMAMGIPVVGTNAGGLPEILEDGKTGFLVPPRDPSALAARTITLLERRDLRKSMGRTGMRNAREHFDFRRNVTGLEALLSRT